MTTTSATLPGASKKMAIVGLKSALNILNRWGSTPEQCQAILQLSQTDFLMYRKDPESANLDHEQMERISFLLNIHAALRTIFENPENVYGFMTMKNNNSYFNGKTPLDILSTGSFAALSETFQQINALLDMP